VCCRETGAWPFACVLSDRDLRQPHLRAQARWHAGGSLAVLPYKGGKCVFLDPRTNLCRTYAARPEACQEFNCTQCLPNGSFLQANPAMVNLIEHERGTAKREPRQVEPRSAGDPHEHAGADGQ
jgi:Fe-S-cluster containining protein